VKDKRASMKDAVASLVKDGDTVVIEGFTHLICFAAGHEITQAAAGKTTIDELVQVMSAVNPYARNTVWLVNPKGWGQVATAAKAILGANLNDGVPMEILGSPVVKCEAVPDTHIAVYGDFSQASQFAFKRNGLEIAASRDRAIEYWQTVFVGCLRLAIANTGTSYVAALKAKTT
jgi:HK97 family phage major capsid protein